MPLSGLRAVAACTDKTAPSLATGLEALGAHARVVAVTEIRESRQPGELDAALDRLDRYDWVIFTSSYGVVYMLKRMAQRGIPAARLQRVKLCAVGAATAVTMRQAGLEPVLIPDEFVAEGIVRAFKMRYPVPSDMARLHILLPRAAQARDVLPRALSEAGAAVDVVVCYENAPAEVDPAVVASLRSQPPDLVVFTSSLAVRNFARMLGGDEGSRIISAATVAALGPITAATVQEYGKTPEILPRESTVEALLEAVREYFEGVPHAS